jgi:hypothetical protein
MDAIQWTLDHVTLPMPDDLPGERLMEIQVSAMWKEPAKGHDEVIPSASITFWLPERLDWSLIQIQKAAFAYVRERLPRLVAALPPAQT